MRRRTLLRMMATSGALAMGSSLIARRADAARRTIDARGSLYGRWVLRDGFPAFVYELESTRPGRTWSAAPLLAMQAFPVSNMHSHAQPLLAYLRLLGVEPTTTGALAVGGGAAFRSRTFRLERTGRGSLHAHGRVVVDTTRGRRQGGPGRVSW